MILWTSDLSVGFCFQCLPFMEYELYNQLVNKLKLKGMNTLFALKVQIVVGEMMLVAIAVSNITN